MERLAIALAPGLAVLLAIAVGAVWLSSWLRIQRKKREIDMHLRRLDSSERMNRAFIHALPDLFFIINADGDYIDYSVPDENILKAPPGGLIGRNIREIFDPPVRAAFMEAVHDVLANGGMRQMEYDLDVPVGLRHFECRIVAMDATRALYIARDITASKTHEVALLRSLHEKEVLLREIHHRVKNNLQVISCLLDMQAERFRDEEDRRLMQETQHRIHSMARLHESLYQSGDFLSIDMRFYLSGIIDELVVSGASGARRVSVINRIESVQMKLESALPVGLIVNELVSNSLKFAFPGLLVGSITVSMASCDSGVILEVSDDGCGLPPDFVPSNARSLGWLLVNSLVIQIGGTLTLVSGQGTSIRIEIPSESCVAAASPFGISDAFTAL